MTVKFRPHHLLCNLGFGGKGYSDEFIENFKRINQQFREDDSLEIEIVEYVDDICAPCPNKRDYLCTKQAKIERLDDAHAEALAIKIGDRLTWQEAKKRITECITVTKFTSICEPCSWKKLGLCEQALTDLLEDTQRMSFKKVHNSNR